MRRSPPRSRTSASASPSSSQSPIRTDFGDAADAKPVEIEDYAEAVAAIRENLDAQRSDLENWTDAALATAFPS